MGYKLGNLSGYVLNIKDERKYQPTTDRDRMKDDSMDNIKVVPNPYIVHSIFEGSQYLKEIKFNHLPSECKITIFTISGEKVITINHEDNSTCINADDCGSEPWDLRSVNNQEVAPGLYFYLVEGNKNQKEFLGKFAIVR